MERKSIRKYIKKIAVLDTTRNVEQTSMYSITIKNQSSRTWLHRKTFRKWHYSHWEWRKCIARCRKDRMVIRSASVTDLLFLFCDRDGLYDESLWSTRKSGTIVAEISIWSPSPRSTGLSRKLPAMVNPFRHCRLALFTTRNSRRHFVWKRDRDRPRLSWTNKALHLRNMPIQPVSWIAWQKLESEPEIEIINRQR